MDRSTLLDLGKLRITFIEPPYHQGVARLSTLFGQEKNIFFFFFILFHYFLLKFPQFGPPRERLGETLATPLLIYSWITACHQS